MGHKKAVSSPSVMQQGVWAPLDTSAVWPPWSKEGLGPTNPPPHTPRTLSPDPFFSVGMRVSLMGRGGWGEPVEYGRALRWGGAQSSHSPHSLSAELALTLHDCRPGSTTLLQMWWLDLLWLRLDAQSGRVREGCP